MVFINQEQLIENGKNELFRQRRKDILKILDHVIQSINPYHLVSSRFQHDRIILSTTSFHRDEFQSLYLIGIGKASVGMAQAVCDAVDVTAGCVITHDPLVKVEASSVNTYYGGHPLPNKGSIEGTKQVMDCTRKCSADDLLIVLISGGGSALFCYPRIPLVDLQKTTKLLLHAGASITQLNTIRKHLSFVKGGQLISSVACPVISLVLSDVINDPLDFIASGPTYPDETTYQDAHTIFDDYSLWDRIPGSVRQIIKAGEDGLILETPTKDSPFFHHVTHEIIGNNMLACQTAAKQAKHLGYHPEIISTSITGEARKRGTWLVNTAQSLKKQENHLFIGGGETTVTVQGSGKGGRNQEMVLGALHDLADTDTVFACLATDGQDGASPAAGAIADGNSLRRAKNQKLDVKTALQQNNSYKFFHTLKDHFDTGPTGSNVMDVFLIIP